jgi:ribonucleoside-triphosphate reductase
MGDGREVAFDPRKLADAIWRAARDAGERDRLVADELTEAVTAFLRRQPAGAPVDIEQVHDLVESVLRDTGQEAIARSFRRLREQRARARSHLQVRRPSRQCTDSTDVTLLVDPLTSEELLPWRRERIARALQVEAELDPDVAEEIAAAVEAKVFASDLRRISTGLIRALVDNELFERDLVGRLRAQQLVGLPAYDLESLILARSRENSTVTSHNPESIARAVAEHTLRRFALRDVFSSDVAGAHLEGRLHLHGLGQALCLGAVVHDLAELLTQGLDLHGLAAVSAPARHADTVTGQLQTYLRVVGCWFAGPQGVAHLNLSYAPFLEQHDDEALYQEAQQLLYATAQTGGAGGGRALAVDFNLVLEVPEHLVGQALVGPGGLPTDRPAEAYLPVARRFARALLQAWGDGDVRGAPFPYPRCVVHLLPGSLDGPDPEVAALLQEAARVATRCGSPVFHFDREGRGGSFPLPGHRPTSGRPGAAACHGQTVSVNLPRIARRALWERGALDSELREVVDLAVKACAQRRQYLKRLASSSELPLWEIGRSRAGTEPRVDFSRLEFHVGVLGLSEAVEMLEPQEEHRLQVALSLLERIRARAVSQGETQGLLVRLVEAPCESASRRLAGIDLRAAEADGDDPHLVVRGERSAGRVYYTRGSCQPVDARLPLGERLHREGLTQRLADGGALSELHPREGAWSPHEVLGLLRHVERQTEVQALALSPLMLICPDCAATFPVEELSDEGGRCPECYGYDARLVTRIAGYLGAVADANPSKVQEVADRSLGNYRPDRSLGGSSR